MRIDRSEFPDTRDKVPLWDAGEHPSPNAPQPAPAARPAPYPMVSLSRAPVVVPNRAYFLFHGAIADTYYWGNTEMWAGETRLRPLHPAFVWPADHAWCVASDVDPHWTGIGADTHMIDQLVHDPHLDVVAADPGADQPAYR